MTIPVVIVGAGPVGLTMALELASYGISSTIFSLNYHHCEGSRAIALHRSALSVWRRLGVTPAEEALAWRFRHTYYRDQLLHTLTLPKPEPGQLPLWCNLPQYRLEQLLFDEVSNHPLIGLHMGCRVIGVDQFDDHVTVTVDTPTNQIITESCKYLVAADGARSSVRKLCNLSFPGRSYADEFLIVDVTAALDWPPEPRMIFDHPTNPGATTLIHPQPHDMWRIDWQLRRSDRQFHLEERISELLDSCDWTLMWSSTYRFHQRLLRQLSIGRVFFVGDAAHLCAPFGARGLNSSIADVASLGPRLAGAIQRNAAHSGLNDYSIDRMPALRADQDAVSATMRFMAPHNFWQQVRTRIILSLARRYDLARGWVDSGSMYPG